MRKFGIFYFIFILAYISLEVFFRDYAINVLGQEAVFSYELRAFEILGRGISSLGFTFLFVSFFSDKLYSFKAKSLFVFLIFSMFYFLLYLLMNNIHVFVNDENKENAYYINLFKQGAYSMPRIEKHLPFEKDFDDNLFKSFYGLSSFLYFNNKTLVNNVKEFEDVYVEVVANNQIDNDLAINEIRYAVFPTPLDTLVFMKASSLHYTDTNTLDWRDKIRRGLLGVAYYSYSEPHSLLNKLNLDVIQHNKRVGEVQSLFNIIDNSNKPNFLWSINDDLRFINSKTNSDNVDNFIRLFGKHHRSAFDAFFVSIFNDMGYNAIKGKSYSISANYNHLPIKEFTLDGFMNFKYAHTKNAYRSEFSDAMSYVFTDISDSDLSQLVDVWVRSYNMYDFLDNDFLYYTYNKYDNNIVSPKDIKVSFQNRERFSHNRAGSRHSNVNSLLENHYKMYDFFINTGFYLYPELLLNDFIDFNSQYIKNLKGDHKTNVKAVLIPPLVLFLLNLAVILNLSLFIVKLIEIKVKNKTALILIYFIVFSLLILFLGSNKGLENDRFENFFNDYAFNNMHISEERVILTKWLIKKNNFFDNYLNVNNNPISTLANQITISLAMKDLDDQEKRFEANLQISQIKGYEKEQH